MSISRVLLLAALSPAMAVAFRGPAAQYVGRRLRFATSMAASAADNHYEYLVIGAGSGGIASARRAATYGAKVAVCEKQALGGTCVNVGCVPKKVMWNAAAVFEHAHEAHNYCISGTEKASIDWKALKTRRDAYVTRLNGIYERNLANSDVTLLTGEASFLGPKTLSVGGHTVTADNVLIAVGGKPAMPDIPGSELCISSDGFFLLEEQPKKCAVVGAGYIAVELAGIFNALGSDTTLLVRGPKALRSFDDTISDTLDSEMKRAGMNVLTGATPKAVTREASGTLAIELENGEVHGGFDQVLMAIGRSPLVDSLALDKAGIDQKPSGHIAVDAFQRTSADGVHALGDVCGAVELTPMAIAAGRRLADRLFDGQDDAKADYDFVPTVVFSHPTIGTIGYTEKDAVEKWGADDITVYKSTFVNLYYGPWQSLEPSEKPKTAYKLVCKGPEQRVVGLHAIGIGSDEMLQGFGVAMKMGATKADFDACIAIHPTASEEMVTMAPWGQKNGKRLDVDELL